jgi:hypothetical protein
MWLSFGSSRTGVIIQKTDDNSEACGVKKVSREMKRKLLGMALTIGKFYTILFAEFTEVSVSIN